MDEDHTAGADKGPVGRVEPAIPREVPRRNAPAHGPSPPRGAPLVCTRCYQTPQQLLRSQADGGLIHAAIKSAPGAGVATICGGRVLERGREWRSDLKPGLVRLCLDAVGGRRAHHVRLGPPNSRRARTWPGTALCGARSVNDVWLPIPGGEAEGHKVCAKCAKATRESGNV